MRRNIFELLNNSEMDLNKEYYRIYELFEDTYFAGYDSVLDCIEEKEFYKWKYRGRFLYIKDLMEELKITDFHFGFGVDIESLILYIEFVENMLSLIQSYRLNDENQKIINMLKENIYRLLEDLNYEVRKNNEDQFVIIEKDKLVTAVAETNPDICDDVIEYRRVILKGNCEAKREILKILSNKIEPYKEKFKNTEYKNMIEDINFLLNNLNIRHNNVEGSKKQQYTIDMKKEDLEKWYDKTYDMILGAIILERYVDIKKEIKDLKQNY